jgi:hypothetical protein
MIKKIWIWTLFFGVNFAWLCMIMELLNDGRWVCNILAVLGGLIMVTADVKFCEKFTTTKGETNEQNEQK